MKHLVHKLISHRNYHRHEKWGVFGVLAFITLVIWSTQSLWIGQAPASANTLYIQNISAPNQISLDKSGEELAVIAMVDKRTNQPAKGVWVGLRIADANFRTPDFTYFDWYSPHPERAFYPANEMGLVYFPMQSKIAGAIQYDIYVGNPDLKTSAKYQSLNRSFTVEYK